MRILYKELGYEVVGTAITVRKSFGLGHKEQIYQRAFEEELTKRGLNYVREPAIKIVSPISKKFIGLYRPDFLVDDKVVVELKAERFSTPSAQKQVYNYLRNSSYELAYLITFSPEKMTIKRIIFTNDRKHHINSV